MTDVPPERLELRARPRPVHRLNRRALMVGAGMLVLLIAGATIVALDPSRSLPSATRPELYNTDRKQTADGLATLPKTYAEIPVLGPPVPGDLGRAFVTGERQLGLRPSASDMQLRPNPEDEAERAERIRQARAAQQARESGLFFRLSDKQKRMPQTAGVADPIPPPSMPLQAGFREERDPLAAALARSLNNNERSAELLPLSQARKLAFVSGRAERETINPHALTPQPSPFTLMAGSVIAASLVTGLNSDVPGQVIAQVTEHGYDSVSGEYLLIPQGSRLIGKYDSVVAFGQKRALLVWTRIILPNGNSIVVDNLPATDAAGYAGLEDEVDFHTWQPIKGIGLATLLGVGTQLTLGNDESDLLKALRQSIQQTTNRAGQRLIERQLDVQPTITVRPGWPVRVVVAKDLVLKPYVDASVRGRE
jgi:type IV secretion system protein TrbI